MAGAWRGRKRNEQRVECAKGPVASPERNEVAVVALRGARVGGAGGESVAWRAEATLEPGGGREWLLYAIRVKINRL